MWIESHTVLQKVRDHSPNLTFPIQISDSCIVGKGGIFACRKIRVSIFLAPDPELELIFAILVFSDACVFVCMYTFLFDLEGDGDYFIIFSRPLLQIYTHIKTYLEA
jgi:hypothetical protein